MKKKVVIGILLIMSAFGFTACGADPVTETTVKDAQNGINLENKARELTGQQGEESEANDSAVENPPE